jgi:hypothetical protein
LIDQTETFFGGQFIMSATHLCGCVQVAMITFQIAATGEIKSDQIWFEIVDGSTITWRINTRTQRFKPSDGTRT